MGERKSAADILAMTGALAPRLAARLALGSGAHGQALNITCDPPCIGLYPP